MSHDSNSVEIDLDRRTFLKLTAATGTALLLGSHKVFSSPKGTSLPYFAVHPFIESHPTAVFIARTAVDVKTNGDAIYSAARDIGRSIFVGSETPGIPLTHNIAVKPNLTARAGGHPLYTVERSMGIITDARFVEGLIDSMKELGIAGNKFYIREVDPPAYYDDGSYAAMAARTGADIRDLSANVTALNPQDVQWVEIPDGTWHRRLPYLWPVNAPDSWLLNVAKLKAHAMGLTLSAKNLQGTIAHEYQAHCTPFGQEMNISSVDVQPNAWATIQANYDRHVAANIPRWDRPGSDGGIWQETWTTRCLDNNSVTHPGLHIIEGIYGRDGHFMDGPSPEGIATDYMTNVVVFGKNPFLIDIVGHWLGGHEPGNFGLFHMAVERGQCPALNPMNIPVYEWKTDGTAVVTSLSNFTRTPLRTLYLRRDYNGQAEDVWHLVNEPYIYGTDSVNDTKSRRPEAVVLHQNYPNPFNPSTSIAYSIPRNGQVRLEIFNALGERVDVPVDAFRSAGSHLAVWNSHQSPSGIYFYRLMFEGFSSTKSMVLVK